jgi:DNA processing protein
VAGTLGRMTAQATLTLISGGARGADHIAMSAAAEQGGSVVGVLVHPLEREALRSDARQLVTEERLCLITPFKPSAGFRPANAMARNKIIYALARCTAVIASDEGRGGTWAGATEAIRRGYGPVAVWTGAGAGPGNAPLAERGAHAFAKEDELLEITRDGYTGRPQRVDQLSLGV